MSVCCKVTDLCIPQESKMGRTYNAGKLFEYPIVSNDEGLFSSVRGLFNFGKTNLEKNLIVEISLAYSYYAQQRKMIYINSIGMKIRIFIFILYFSRLLTCVTWCE